MAKTKWQLKREASYEAIVESAIRVFHARGYSRTRVEDIVEGTGYSKGAFYFHFRDKQDCFWHANDQRERQRGEWWTAPASTDPDTTSLEDLLATVMGGFTPAYRGHNAWVLVMVDCYHQHRDDPDTRDRFRAAYTQWHSEIADFVRALQTGGWIHDKDPDLLATRLFAYGEGLVTHATLYDLDPTTTREALQTGLHALLTT